MHLLSFIKNPELSLAILCPPERRAAADCAPCSYQVPGTDPLESLRTNLPQSTSPRSPCQLNRLVGDERATRATREKHQHCPSTVVLWYGGNRSRLLMVPGASYKVHRIPNDFPQPPSQPASSYRRHHFISPHFESLQHDPTQYHHQL